MMKGIILLTILLVIQPLPNLADLSHVSESPIDRLNREVAELQSQMMEIQKENKEVKLEVTDVKNENRELKSELIKVKTEVEDLKSKENELKNGQDLHSKEITRLDTKIGNNQMDLSLLLADIEGNVVQLKVLDTKIVNNTNLIQNNTNFIDNHSNQIETNGYNIQTNKASIKNLHLAPIGSIIAWTPRPAIGNETLTMKLPKGWVRCNGHVIPSPSPWAGIRTPNLNSDRRFLRGGHDNHSLTFEDDMFQDHRHPDNGHKHEDSGHKHELSDSVLLLNVVGNGVYGYFDANYRKYAFARSNRLHEGKAYLSRANIQVAYADIGDPNTGSHGSETRPKNMGVVWIMRIY